MHITFVASMHITFVASMHITIVTSMNICCHDAHHICHQHAQSDWTCPNLTLGAASHLAMLSQSTLYKPVTAANVHEG